MNCRVATESAKEADNADTTKRLKWVAKYGSCPATIDPHRLKKQPDLFIWFFRKPCGHPLKIAPKMCILER